MYKVIYENNIIFISQFLFRKYKKKNKKEIFDLIEIYIK